MEPVMINVKEATQIALEYFADLFKGKNVLGVELEEVEKTEDDQYWLITLGYHIPNQAISGGILDVMRGPTMPRKYKTFKVNSQTREVVAMKIRDVSGAN
jgi:hypothetical protein